MEVVEVCRPCVKWDCDGRTYAIDCYLKLLVRLYYYIISGATARFGGKQNQSDGEKGGHRIEQLKLKGEGS